MRGALSSASAVVVKSSRRLMWDTAPAPNQSEGTPSKHLEERLQHEYLSHTAQAPSAAMTTVNFPDLCAEPSKKLVRGGCRSVLTPNPNRPANSSWVMPSFVRMARKPIRAGNAFLHLDTRVGDGFLQAAAGAVSYLAHVFVLL
jgi:hypothetical protein